MGYGGPGGAGGGNINLIVGGNHARGRHRDGEWREWPERALRRRFGRQHLAERAKLHRDRDDLGQRRRR